MRRLRSVIAGVAAALSGPVLAGELDGMIEARSPVPVPALIDRVDAFVTAHGATVVARVDHAAAGAGIGMPLRPTVLIAFGNPRIGTPLMRCEQRIGIDLPLKALAWEDEAGQVWLGVTNPAALAARHGAGLACADAVKAAAGAMRALVEAVTKP